MALASGLGSQFALAQETTYATVVTPNRFYEFNSETFKREPTYLESVGLRAGRTFQPAGRVVQTTRQGSGAVAMDIPTRQFGSILNLMHQLTVTPVQQGVTTAYKQTHLVGTSQPNRSATLQFNKPDSGGVDHPYTYPGSVLTSTQFSCAVGGYLTSPALTFDAQDELTTISTPAGPTLAAASYPAGIESWNQTQATVTMGGSSVGIAKSFDFTWSQPYKTDRWFLGSGGTKLKPIPNGFAAVTGTVVLEFADLTHYTRFLNGTPVVVIFDFVGSTIASTYKNQITFTFDQFQYRGDSPNVAGPDVLELSVPFSIFDGGTNPPLQIDYTSVEVTLP